MRHLLLAVVLGGCIDDAPDDDTDTVPPGLLDPTTIPQFVTPLVIPPELPALGVVDGVTEYHVAVRQLTQRVLPEPFPETPLWAYGRPDRPETFHSPAFTIEARRGRPVRVTWENGLVDDDGAWLPHLLPVDQTLHWANPGGQHAAHGESPEPYTGPVPIVTHLHGGHTPDSSDGYPEAWWMPDAVDFPDGMRDQGEAYATERPAGAGQAVFEYPNDQRASTLWYHDHALGITRLNVYAGLAGFWLLRDDEEDALGLPGPAPRDGDADGTRYFEVPLAIQDRTFWEDGTLFYPSERAFFDGYDGPTAPDGPIAPIWNPEFFGDTMMVNGRTWPELEVEPRLYRFRLLNGCNSRFLELDLDHAGLGFVQVGADGGLLAGAPHEADTLLLGPAERADVLVDFSGLAEGTEVLLLNLGPDAPFKGVGSPENEPSDPETTGRVMRFRITASTGQGMPGAVPEALPDVAPLATALAPRDLALFEETHEIDGEDVVSAAELGTITGGMAGWDEALTERIRLGDTEIWRLVNFTEDAHPIHLHQVMFQVLDRTPVDVEGMLAAREAWVAGDGPVPTVEAFVAGAAVPPGPAESAWKDTVIVNPGEVARIVATFDLPGRYVWHCHILEHEDNEMMRPFDVYAP